MSHPFDSKSSAFAPICARSEALPTVLIELGEVRLVLGVDHVHRLRVEDDDVRAGPRTHRRCLSE
jgi:hypothetical protein